MTYTKRTTAWNWFSAPDAERDGYTAYIASGRRYVEVSYIAMPGDCLIAVLAGEMDVDMRRYVVAANTPLYLVAR